MSKSIKLNHPENLELPNKNCDNCLHGYMCVCYGQSIRFLNAHMSFFNKTQLPPGVNPTIVDGLRQALANHCLYYERKGQNVIPSQTQEKDKS